MEEIVKSLTRIAIDRSKNPYIRFILKKNQKQLKMKAYKELTIELFLHSIGKNKSVLRTQLTVNTAGVDENMVWELMEPVFTYEVIKWAMSKEWEDLIDEYKME